MNYDFFFQAEDGIRDLIVTGVQTCALPIWATKSSEVQREVTRRMEDFVALGIRLQHPVLDPVVHHLHIVAGAGWADARVTFGCGQGAEDGLAMLERGGRGPDHEAISFFQPPDPAAHARIHE